MSRTLTRREFQVGLLLAEGLTDKAIALKLKIKPQTVRFHVHRIAQKLGYERDADTSVRVRIAKDPALNTVTGDLVANGS